MKSRVGVVLARTAAIAVGVVWGFFVAFNVVFSDVFGVWDMLYAILYVLVAYFGLGLVLGALGPRTGWKWAWWVSPPGMVFAGLMLLDDPGRVLYTAGVIASVFTASLAGAWLGAYVRNALSRRRSAASGMRTGAS